MLHLSVCAAFFVFWTRIRNFVMPMIDGEPNINVKSVSHTPSCMRLIVDRVDGSLVYGHVDDSLQSDVHFKLEAFEVSYLPPMLTAGSQLNLVGVRTVGDGTVMAEALVYEPDYLVNVSQVASCFESYATDARLSIVKALMPPQNSAAICLGNFASQLLDEEIHRDGEGRSYADSVKDFFCANALKLAACDIPATFHADAMRQKAAVSRAISSCLPAQVGTFKRDNVMLEPAFFSEMLGLQGRMDFLQLDYSVLVEQKSGKGAWPFDGFAVPKHTRSHYVQLLLYMAIMRYNYSDTFDADAQKAFLLYSRYAEPLLAIDFSPLAFVEAMKVRNEIVWYNTRLAKGDDLFLRELKAEDFRQEVNPVFWERYVEPGLDAVLSPMRHNDALTLRYYYRMLRFVSEEALLAKVGEIGVAASGFASLWRDSFAEKSDGGNILAGLDLVEPDVSHRGKVERVVLRFNGSCLDAANFRVGDLVVFYPYFHGQEPDVCHTMVFRATVVAFSDDCIVLSLRFAQSSALPFCNASGNVWAVEHDMPDASYAGLFCGLHSFLTAPAERRDLLMLRRKPLVDGDASLVGDYGKFNELAVRVKQAKELFLIVGPPGTGKTSFGLMTTLKEHLSQENGDILLLAYTNRAVDEMCSKLVADGLDFVRIGPEMSASPEYRSHLVGSRVAACANVSQVRAVISSARIMVATVSSLNANRHIFSLKSFDLTIIDEASQIVEPQLLGILSATDASGMPSVKKVVMIGDHKQLSAVVKQKREQSSVDDVALREIGLTDCRCSLFERLLRRYGNDPAVCYTLTRQGRMHAELAAFVSEHFYGGCLEPVPLPHQLALLPECGEKKSVFDSSRFVFVDVEETAVPNVSDKVNYREAEVIARMVADIRQREASFEPADTVGIIVPYRNQIAAVRQAMVKVGITGADAITVDTVERFQGSQRKYIIYGFTVKQPYQLDFLTDNVFVDNDGTPVDRKLNVALTRAREYMALVGNVRLLSSDEIFSSLISHVRHHGLFVEAK